MKRKKWLAAAVAALLAAALVPVSAMTGEGQSSAAIHQAAINSARPQGQEGQTAGGSISFIFLHGNAAILAEGSSEGLTKLYLDKNADGRLDGGDEAVSLSNASGDLQNGYDLSNSVIYCVGTFDWPGYQEHEGDILVTMTGGTVKEINGSLLCSNTGDFIFTMTGGRVEQKVMATGSAANWFGNTYISAAGNASIGQAIYGGSENGNCAVKGEVHVRLAENAQVNAGGRYGDGGVFAGGQQPGATITGDATISVEGGAVNGTVAGDLYNTTFQKKVSVTLSAGTVGNLVGLYSGGSTADSVSVALRGGTVNYNVIGSRGAVTGDTSLHLGGGTVKSTVAGASGGTVGGGVRLEIEGGTCEAGIIGLNGTTAAETALAIKGGTVASNVIGRQGAGSCGKAAIHLEAGTVGGLVALRANGDVAAAQESAIEVKGAPAFGESGAILLRPGEFVTEVGDITGGDGSVKIDVGGIDSAGALVVKQGVPGAPAQLAKYAVSNSAHRLLYGAAQSTAENLYLGLPATGNCVADTVSGQDAPDAQSNIDQNKEAYLDEEDNKAILAGQDVRIVLSVNDAGQTAADGVKEAIAAHDSGAAIAQYLDISITKYIDSAEEGKLEVLPSEVEITLSIPESFRAAGRTFYIIRTHQFQNQPLEVTTLADEDSSPDTITFHTSKFSTYALAYQDCSHTHDGSWKADETHHWHECSICATVLERAEHAYGGAWVHDGESHWKGCVCGATGQQAAHSFREVIDRAATATEAGSKHAECTVCGYETAAVEIPATGGQTPAPPSGGEGSGEGSGNREPAGADSPQTGGGNLPLCAAAASIGAAALGTALFLQKRSRRAGR